MTRGLVLTAAGPTVSTACPGVLRTFHPLPSRRT